MPDISFHTLCMPPTITSGIPDISFHLYACRPPSHPARLISLFTLYACRPPSRPACLISLFPLYACRPPSHPAYLTSLFPLYACRPSAQFYRGHSGKQFKDLNFHKCLTKPDSFPTSSPNQGSKSFALNSEISVSADGFI